MKEFLRACRSWALFVVAGLGLGIVGGQACGCSGASGGGSGSGFGAQVGQFVANAEACAKAEGQAIASGKSVLDVANAVVAAFQFVQGSDANAIESAIAGLIATYGEPIVACAVVKGETPSAGSGTMAGLADSARRELAKRHGWQP